MNFCRKLVLCGATAATISMAGAAVANADQVIDFGMNEAACQSSAHQADAAIADYLGFHQHSYCYQTGPGYYSLFYAN
jgi:hypothetical protein